MVVWDAAVAQRQLDQVALNQIPVLLVGAQQLAPYCHNASQRALLAMPGVNVPFVRGAITPAQVGSHRPSYINAILIQSRGVLSGPCDRCERSLRPFLECRRVPGHFGGACGNCKWPDLGARCTERDNDDDGSIVVVSSDSSDDGNVPPPRLTLPAPPPRPGEPGFVKRRAPWR